MSSPAEVEQIRSAAYPLRGAADLDPLLYRVGDARYVLIGAASYGTSGFCRWRAELTRRLITECGFSFVAVDGDWPGLHRVHCSVVGAPGAPDDPVGELAKYQRWPEWMWANEEVAAFVAWLGAVNAGKETVARVGLHGLDVYSLRDSLRRIVIYLNEYAQDEVDNALDAFRCFEPSAGDPRRYGYAKELVPENCREAVVRLLTEARAEVFEEETPAIDSPFVAEQDAEIVARAEEYYRELVRGGPWSWNVRERHLADMLDRLVDAYGRHAKAVVWAHNTQVGDARATDMAQAGMVNLGQLLRQRHHERGVLAFGFGTHRGSVLAAGQWGAEAERMTVTPARPESAEGLLHQAVPDSDSLFVFGTDGPQWSREVRGHRAIGVLYPPDGYVPTELASRYDAFAHCDESEALTPLDRPDSTVGG